MATPTSPDYQVLARKYRPQTFDQVVGQEHVVRTLRNALKTGRLAHAYLFVGPRGIGKTSTARILAMALNAPGGPRFDFDPNDPVCREIAEGRSLDVREIDGASNNGVEEVRQLRDDVRYLPQSGRFKIYIIDEVHMLSTQAFNALLKTLEEPPAYVKFIFATTEVHKVLPTILSRCQRFDLRRIPAELIARQLQMIAQAEGIQIEPAAVAALAQFADGGLRDAESSFDQLIAFCGTTITEADVLQIFGLPPHRSIAALTDALLAGEIDQAWTLLDDLDQEGKDLGRVLADTVKHLRNLLIHQRAPRLLEREINEEQRATFDRQAGQVGHAKLLRLVESLSGLESRLRFALSPKAILQVGLASACEIPHEVELDDVLEALADGGTSEPRRAAQPLQARPPRARTAPDASARPAAPAEPETPAPSRGAPRPAAAPPTTPAPAAATRASAPPPQDESFEEESCIAPVAAALLDEPEPEPVAPLAPAPRQPDPLSIELAWAQVKELIPPMMRNQLEVRFEGSRVLVSAERPVMNLLRNTVDPSKLQHKLGTLLGRPGSIEWSERDAAAPAATVLAPGDRGTPAAGSDPADAALKAVEQEFLDDPLIKEALERFGAKLVAVRKGVTP